MKKGIAGLAMVQVMLLAGCGFTHANERPVARPLLVEGYYYMAGDDNCAKGATNSNGTMMCYDQNQVFTGYRQAITPEQLQAYQLEQLSDQAQQLREQQNRAELNAQLRQIGQQWQSAGQQAVQQSQSWGAPTVQGIPSQGGTTGVIQVGNTFIGTDGRSCQVVGQSTICR